MRGGEEEEGDEDSKCEGNGEGGDCGVHLFGEIVLAIAFEFFCCGGDGEEVG